MKLGSAKLLIAAFLLSAVLSIGLIDQVNANQQQPVYNAQDNKDLLLENYEEPKNIMFASMFGGSTHVTWMLSILDELSKRGHNITIVTRVSLGM